MKSCGKPHTQTRLPTIASYTTVHGARIMRTTAHGARENAACRTQCMSSRCDKRRRTQCMINKSCPNYSPTRWKTTQNTMRTKHYNTLVQQNAASRTRAIASLQAMRQAALYDAMRQAAHDCYVRDFSSLIITRWVCSLSSTRPAGLSTERNARYTYIYIVPRLVYFPPSAN